MENEFTVLMYLGNYVDESRLDKGIYATSKPTLHGKDDTLEIMASVYGMFKDIKGIPYFRTTALNNLKQCKLVKVKVAVN